MINIKLFHSKSCPLLVTNTTAAGGTIVFLIFLEYLPPHGHPPPTPSSVSVDRVKIITGETKEHGWTDELETDKCD